MSRRRGRRAVSGLTLCCTAGMPEVGLGAVLERIELAVQAGVQARSLVSATLAHAHSAKIVRTFGSTRSASPAGGRCAVNSTGRFLERRVRMHSASQTAPPSPARVPPPEVQIVKDEQIDGG